MGGEDIEDERENSLQLVHRAIFLSFEASQLSHIHSSDD